MTIDRTKTFEITMPIAIPGNVALGDTNCTIREFPNRNRAERPYLSSLRDWRFVVCCQPWAEAQGYFLPSLRD